MSKLLPTSRFKWIDHKEFHLNKYTSNSSKGCVLEVEVEYPKELRELHNDYLLPPDKIEIKRGMFSNYQLNVFNIYNIPIGNVKKLGPNFFDKEKYVIYYENLQLYLRLELKLKKLLWIRIQSISVAKALCWIKHKERIQADKKWWERWKSLVKINEHMNFIYGKTMENVRNRINVKLVSKKKDYLNWRSKPSYISHKRFDNSLVAMGKNKCSEALNKPTFNRMWILELNKVLIYEFHYGYIKNKYDNNSRLLFTDTDSLIYEIKTEDVYQDFSNGKEMFHFSNYLTKYKYHDHPNKLVVGKMKDEAAGVAIKEVFGLKPKMYSYLVDDNSEHKKGLNRNLVATIRRNRYEEVLLNKKCLRDSMSRIQSKDQRIETYEIINISLSCFDDKIYIQNNRCDGFALG